nr:farnesyl diphosphate synthase [Maliibacterium massiliense]
MSLFAQQYQTYLDRTNQALSQALCARSDIPSPLREAMGYSLEAGGKRIRPVLLLACCDIAGGDTARALPFACAVEMIHTYSLIHDDLPCMDNDDLRRGRPTCHKVYGEGMALLAGDGLLNFAYEHMSDAVAAGVPGAAQALREIACGAGVGGMIAGQCLDLANEGRAMDGAMLRRIHNGKTAALLTAACTAGMCLAGADARRLEAARAYGRALGLAFQITDDVLDVAGDAAHLGKHTGKDAQSGKLTFVSVYGLEKARALAREAVQEAVGALRPFGGDAMFLCQMAQFVLGRDH